MRFVRDEQRQDGDPPNGISQMHCHQSPGGDEASLRGPDESMPVIGVRGGRVIPDIQADLMRK